jgi:hypothetical protein
MKPFPLVRNETRIPTFPTLIQYTFGIPRQSNKTREKNKRDSNKEGRSQNIPICDDMILFLKDPKNSTKIYLGH